MMKIGNLEILNWRLFLPSVPRLRQDRSNLGFNGAILHIQVRTKLVLDKKITKGITFGLHIQVNVHTFTNYS